MSTSSNVRHHATTTRYGSFRLALALIIALAGLLAVFPSSVGATSPNLSGSKFEAAPTSIAYGQHVTFTVTLRNTGAANATAGVAVPLPDDLVYVEGSASSGGVKQGKAITWNNVPVPANATVALTLRATPAAAVSEAKSVTTAAAITSPNQIFTLRTTITLTPTATPPPPPDLAGSSKFASRETLAHDEELTYTIRLVNSGASATVVNVRDPLTDNRLEYVAGSATGGGVYDETSKVLTWTGVNVPMGGSVDLTFKVRSIVHVIVPSQSTNVATITVGDTSFTRSASVWLVMASSPPPPPSDPILTGSFKRASQETLSPGEELTYTIGLVNTGGSTATVKVVDPIPAELEYVAGSVTGGGSYNSETRTLTWEGVEVASRETKSLTFKARPATTVTSVTPVVNRATISSGALSFERSARVMLLPEEDEEERPVDRIPPRVDRVTINDGVSTVTERNVTLQIDAWDNVAVTRMMIEEWRITTRPPRWEKVRSSEWVTFARTYDWELGAESGTRLIAVQVQDAAGNTSRMSRNSIATVSLLTPGEVGEKEFMPYMAYFEAGVDVTATLTTLTGDADLYVWYPGRVWLPNRVSLNPGTATDSVSFRTPRAGVYLFLVYGAEASTYTLSIVPAGTQPALSPDAAPAETAKAPAFTAEPLLRQIGLDPFGVTEAPPAATPETTVFLSFVAR